MTTTHTVNPINQDNARSIRITAAAGNELADAFSSGTRAKHTLGLFFFQAEDGIRDTDRSRGLGDVYKRQDYQGI